jgi:hypothetical protein
VSITDDRWKQSVKEILVAYSSTVEKLSDEKLITLHREHLKFHAVELVAITRTELDRRGFADGPGLSSDRMEPPPVRSEHPEQDARRYYLLRAYLLLTSLNRRVRLNVSSSDSEALRYRLLQNHLLSSGIIRHVKLPPGETAPLVGGRVVRRDS